MQSGLLCIPVFRLDMFVWLRYSDGLVKFSFKSGLNGVCINNNRASLQHQELHVHSPLFARSAWVLPQLTSTEVAQETGLMDYRPFPRK